jgi:hypothetical protein
VVSSCNVEKVTKRRLRKALSYCVERRGYGFFDGGCLIFAEACKILWPKGEIVTIARGKGRKPDHYGFMIDSGVILDGDGFYPSPEQWILDFRRKENVAGADLYFERGRIESSEIPRDSSFSSQIAKVLVGG